jgi:hypothetical protein
VFDLLLDALLVIGIGAVLGAAIALPLRAALRWAR